MDKGETLKSLERLLRLSSRRNRRSTTLLRDPHADYPQDWFICVPRCFNNALDIKLTKRIVKKIKEDIWTQGSNFSFETGDVLYDTIKGYSLWDKALNEIGISIQITAAKRVIPGTKDTKRDPGTVEFKIYKADKHLRTIRVTGEYKMTQDEFVRFLITGEGLTGNRTAETNHGKR